MAKAGKSAKKPARKTAVKPVKSVLSKAALVQYLAGTGPKLLIASTKRIPHGTPCWRARRNHR